MFCVQISKYLIRLGYIRVHHCSYVNNISVLKHNCANAQWLITWKGWWDILPMMIVVQQCCWNDIKHVFKHQNKDYGRISLSSFRLTDQWPDSGRQWTIETLWQKQAIVFTQNPVLLPKAALWGFCSVPRWCRWNPLSAIHFPCLLYGYFLNWLDSVCESECLNNYSASNKSSGSCKQIGDKFYLETVRMSILPLKEYVDSVCLLKRLLRECFIQYNVGLVLVFFRKIILSWKSKNVFCFILINLKKRHLYFWPFLYLY